MEVDQEKARAVEKMKVPTNLKEVSAVLGLVRFHKNFIPGFGKTPEFLYNFLKKEESSSGRSNVKVL